MKPQTKKYLWILVANAILLVGVIAIWGLSLTLSVPSDAADETKRPVAKLEKSDPVPPDVDIKPIKQGSFKNIEILNETRLLPSIPYMDENGKIASLSDLTGQWTVVNFWASWCPPCLVELPTLAKLAELYKPEKLRVIAISLDIADDAGAVTEMYTRRDIPLIARYWDKDARMLSALKLDFLPTTYVIHPDGRVFAILQGDTDWAGRDATTFIESILHPETAAQSLDASSGTKANKSPTTP